jgi:hypothetical protein
MSAQPKASTPTSDEKARFDQVKRQGQPTDNHKKLAALVGEWDVTTATYSAPGAEPSVSKGGRSSVKAVYGGRHFTQTTDETFLGEQVQRMSQIGYNARRMLMYWTGYNSYTTELVVAEGPIPDGANEISLQANHHVDSFTGSRDTPGARISITLVGPGQHVVRVFESDPINTKEYLARESVFTRK